MTNAPHRRERLSTWMQAEDVTCAVLFGADHVTHLTGYARYFGGPSAVVVVLFRTTRAANDLSAKIKTSGSRGKRRKRPANV